MPFRVDTNEAPAFLRFTIGGAWPSIEDQKALRQGLIDRGLLTGESRALIDIRDVTALPTAADLRAGVEAGRSQGGALARRAYLVLRGVQFGLIRMMQVIAEDPAVEVFTTEEEALRWLRSDDPKLSP